ncbi:thiol-disulfide oxidoreductase [Posidoniimonas corsicana]|uniref:Thiol-disulfide oxidoreductase n=1 Tax=Posidoniimonas corsicana TaxID=1938618 RepID=A0A5C5VJ75_9BACT|nr:TlpA disulfide reductase family protein [Posidoniimonas corsicana]TWT38017.1 thiol-disulfide oxidoreductase [Posidoniimonas corsicana]
MDPEPKAPQPSSSNLVPILLIGGLLVAGVLLRPGRFGGASEPHTPQPLPPLDAAGWLNADAAPATEGKIVVLDAWFTTCGPCLASLPKLARLHERYGANGRVQFVGLTFEEEDLRPQVEAVINRVDGFNWPVGYGAGLPLEMLDIHMFPTLMVFDASGTSVWRGHDIGALERQLEKML